jgi:hypothetical protein
VICCANLCSGRALVLPLHGSLSSEEQGRVFGPPPQGMVKIILATNVAESSVTIDDVSRLQLAWRSSVDHLPVCALCRQEV